MTATTQTVREIALEQPTSIRVFEQYGIDYCCGGRKPLAEACAVKDVEVGDVIAALEAAARTQNTVAEDWSKKSLAVLSAHIVATHHAYVTRELSRLADLANKVVDRHGSTNSELPVIQSRLAQLDQELRAHQGKEEAVLFPYIASLERAIADGGSKPHHSFTVANPIATMLKEHDAAGALMEQIRSLSHDYSTPEGACPTYHAFYDGLRDFEQDLHRHIHLENNILFPRAISLEESAN